MAEDIARIVRESRAKQGLPPKVTDKGIIAKVVALITSRPADLKLPKHRKSRRA